jgi:hypothetical protein
MAYTQREARVAVAGTKIIGIVGIASVVMPLQTRF